MPLLVVEYAYDPGYQVVKLRAAARRRPRAAGSTRPGRDESRDPQCCSDARAVITCRCRKEIYSSNSLHTIHAACSTGVWRSIPDYYCSTTQLFEYCCITTRSTTSSRYCSSV